MYQSLKSKGLGQDEQEFVDQPLATERQDGMPLKPRYYNSVKTGFEWNKYN
jgi:hypothetical protein